LISRKILLKSARRPYYTGSIHRNYQSWPTKGKDPNKPTRINPKTRIPQGPPITPRAQNTEETPIKHPNLLRKHRTQQTPKTCKKTRTLPKKTHNPKYIRKSNPKYKCRGSSRKLSGDSPI